MIDFDELYAQHAQSVHNRLSKLVYPDDVDDCAQQVWRRVWLALPRLPHAGNISGWLWTVATNVAHDHHRATAAKTRGATCPLAEDMQQTRGERGDPADFVPERLETSASVSRVWQRADPRDRAVMRSWLTDGTMPANPEDFYRARRNLKELWQREQARETRRHSKPTQRAK